MTVLKIGMLFDGGIIIRIDAAGITTIRGEFQCVVPKASVEQILVWEKAIT